MTYGYDYVGRLLQAVDPIISGDPSTGTWSIAYDTAGRRATDTGSDNKVIQYTYDGASNRTYVTYPDSKRIETLFDQLNRDYEIAYCTSSCGTTALDHLNALDRLTQRGFAAPAPGIYSNYSYAGPDTLLTQIVHYFDPSGSATYAYTYNKARQVATESQTGTLVTIEGAAVASYTNDTSDRIATQNESNFSYDGNSDLTSDGTRTYTYDQEGDGRVLTASASGLSASYHYDAYGRRYSKTVNGTTTVYVYDNLGKIAAEYDGSGNVLRDYAYLSRETGPVSTWEANGHINYLQHDRLGTLVALSGGGPGSATLITNWYAQPDYGTTDLFTAGVTFGYAGYYFDQETGLYKTASRYYDPRLGRFITPDPIGQQGGLNIYAYVGNDPINLSDPSGSCPWCIALAGSALAGGAIDLATQLITNGGHLGSVSWTEVGVAAAVSGGLSGLGPSGWLLGRGGVRAAQFGYDQAPGLLNRGAARFGWSYNAETGSEVLSGRIGNTHYDIPWTSISPGAAPARDAAVAGIAGGATVAGVGQAAAATPILGASGAQGTLSLK